MTSEPHFGLTGLATMGANLARNVAHHDIPVAVHNRTTSRMEKFMEEHGYGGAADAATRPSRTGSARSPGRAC